MKLNACPLCGDEGYYPLLAIEKSPTRHIRLAGALDRPGDYGDLEIAGCTGCGHVYNRAFDSALEQDLYHVHPSTNAPVHDSMLRGLRDIAAYILDNRTARPKILEIGCGVGALARLLAAQAESIHLIEPNLSLTEASFNNPRITLLPGFFPSASTGQRYDLIICRQVLEHIADPLPFLNAIRESLAPDGEVYIEIPSMDYIVEHASPTDFHYLHVQYFTKAAIENLFARLGFRVVRSCSIKNGHDLGYVLAAGGAGGASNSRPVINLNLLRSRIEARVENGRRSLAAMSTPPILYGACAYTQAFFGIYPDMQRPTAIFDDTEAYAGHEAYHRNWQVPVTTPRTELLKAASHIVICSYLHDRPIAKKLDDLGIAGCIMTLRTDTSAGKDAPASIFS